MFVNSVMNEGLAGMQQSQKRMLESAQEIVRGGRSTDHSGAESLERGGAAPVSNNGISAEDLPSTLSVSAVTEPEATEAARPTNSVDNLVGPLVELKREELVFDASASVVRVADETIGRLIDDLS